MFRQPSQFEKAFQRRWLVTCREFGLNGEDHWHRILAAYKAPERVYHNIGHIFDCFIEFDVRDVRYRLSKDQYAVEMAIWFHDYIYNTKAHDNEERSAEAARNFLKDSPKADAVAELILATKHDRPPPSADAALLCDVDLRILGSDRVGYEAYAAAIRQEYAWVPSNDYAAGRIIVLKKFLERPKIFCLDVFRRLYERKARSNIKAEIKRLSHGCSAPT